ncbi:MAG: histidine kinase dimerization/phosphoacceptor domain-containing protein [Nocardiopsaceae bacterium]|jgi:signal transduction histidine kinase|nr:histidine kinase dimerization/phosphoacceptor domain-containing protein [Nocardiopsaceae bacterium]
MPGSELVRDAALPFAVVVLSTVESALADDGGRGFALAFVAAGCLCLALRRWRPLLMCTLAGVVPLMAGIFRPEQNERFAFVVGVLYAVYYVARAYADLRGLVVVGSVLLAVNLGWIADGKLPAVDDLLWASSLLVPPFVFGRIMLRLAERRALTEANRELVRRQAVLDERDRIACELNDVVAHSLSAMVLQSAAAQDLVRTDPRRSEAMAAEVAATGRRALHETGRLLHAIRDDADELGLRRDEREMDARSTVGS